MSSPFYSAQGDANRGGPCGVCVALVPASVLRGGGQTPTQWAVAQLSVRDTLGSPWVPS